ncbi:MFS transporter [Methanosphaerula palustris]|uniref:Drug resistance transporter, EmrB/QacA subfamily n=1 Tax=Methanosphaerula palustris (strain ATCC BAA-1556 / DSM 19958 / E1-9c) TaxID=521011 RepID=B8GGZ4_METPE|nr:MFS transporter [Methanosphaerula palustris]ACL16399.1 drug resistance transporter, EmrB/QacA subfamily [Methanosphaerula palustris E1-9c]
MESTSQGTDQKGLNLLILSISLATFMSSLDGTIVNIALPTISSVFNISSSTVSWVATIYLLVMAGCVLIFGKLSDSVGFKRMFLSGFVIFTLGSFLCGLLPDLLSSFFALIGSRAFQAIGGAMITAIAPAMIAAYIPMKQKGKAMGIVMTVAALGTAIGPTIGGVLTQYISWHWIFFINVPVGICAIILGLRVIPTTQPHNKNAGFDRAGALLIFTGLAALLFAVSEGQSLGWDSPVILGSLALALITLGYFVWHELRTADPLLELRLFKNKNFLMTNLVLSLVFFSFAGISYLLPFYLQYIKGFSSSDAGMIITALSVAMMVSGLLSGALYNRVGGRILCIASGIFLVAGYFMMTLLRVDTSIGFVILCLLVLGFSLGLMITPASNMIMNSVAKRYQGMVSSLTSLERFAPLTLGIAFANLVFIQGITAIADNRGITESAPVNIKLHLITAGFDLAFFFSLVIAVIILILTLLARQEVHPDYQSGTDEDALNSTI